MRNDDRFDYGYNLGDGDPELELNIKLVVNTTILTTIICLVGFCCVFARANGHAVRDDWDKVDDLVTTITSNCTTQKQKLDSVYFWIIRNISYDWEGAQKVISGSGTEPDLEARPLCRYKIEEVEGKLSQFIYH